MDGARQPGDWGHWHRRSTPRRLRYSRPNTGATGATVVGRRAAEARSLQVCGTLFYADFKGIQCHRHERVVANDTHELR